MFDQIAVRQRTDAASLTGQSVGEPHPYLISDQSLRIKYNHG